jgi:predicted Zn-dependent protease
MVPSNKSMKRRNAMHVIVWCFVALLALIFLSELRQYGQAAVMRYNGYHSLETAWVDYAGGNTSDAQYAITRLARAQPRFEDDVIRKFGQHLLAMPTALQQLFPEDDQPSDDTDHAILGLIFAGDTDQAAERIDTALDRNVLSRAVVLWRAHEAMRKGDLDAARNAYEWYWKDHVDQRLTVSDRIVVQEATLEERVNALLWSGLWDEAIAVSASVRDAREEPIALLCAGISAELNGDVETARSSYEKVLVNRPTNHLARLRIDKLE